MLTPLFGLVVGAMLAERALELVINRRNARTLRERGARWLGRDGFALILVSQVLLFGFTAAEVALAPWSGEHAWTIPVIGLLVLAQALRYWCIATLGWRWSIRVVTVPGAPRITGGPYRWFPHPNYLVVMGEAVLLPLAFGAWLALLVVAPLQLVALWRRVRLEEGALGAAQAARA